MFTSARLLGLFLSLLALGCIKRTAPPATGPGVVKVAPPSRAAEAAAARIAGISRTQILGDWRTAFHVHGEEKKVEASLVKVEGQPFDQAMRLDLKEGCGHEYAVQWQAANVGAVESGDALLATFYLRSEKPQESGVAQTEFVFELGQSPYTKSISYPIYATSEWNKVQVRFQSAGTYEPQKAHMIFRLGYEPQTLWIAGVTVENFGKRVSVGMLPNTRAADRRRERAILVEAGRREAEAYAKAPAQTEEVLFSVDTATEIGPISPYVYGINSQKFEGINTTVRRMGGNRQSAYNWENNASNAGSDYHHQSDEWPCTFLGYKNCSEPGAQFANFAKINRQAGMETLATIPLLDYVTADKNGPVSEAEKAPSPRWVKSQPKKPTAYSLKPDLNDGVVYQDEFVNLLVSQLGKADQGGIRYYSMDNEPALWPGTHARVHPLKTTYAEVVARTEAYAKPILDLDPGAIILGGVLFGWSEFMSLTTAPDAVEHNATYGTYLDYLLASFKKLEEKHQKRLVHVLDIHWYPEVKGNKRITEPDTAPKTVVARVQAPRSLWDPGYKEKSWIGDTWGKPIRLIPWMKERIAERYAGTKLSMTEYNFGAGNHVSGGIAQADVLGVFGREGLYMANYWGNGAGNDDIPPFIQAAWKLFRNYDGKNHTFGDRAVATTTSQLEKATIYAATDSRTPGRMTIVLINKEIRTNINAVLDLKKTACKNPRRFAFDGQGPDIRSLDAPVVKGSTLTLHLAPLSASIVVCGET